MSDNQQEQKINTTELTVTAAPEFLQYDLNRQSIYVNCNLRAPPTSEDAKRSPIEVVVVLDRSGSMAGERLRLCLKTMEFLIQELTAADRLAIITYDDIVKTECRLTRMDTVGKEQVTSIINSIHSGGMTNLSGGLMEGIQEIQSETRIDGQPPNEVKSILLLTDGHANVGITQTEGLVGMIKGCLQPHVSLFTFGYGSNHNETMLRTISDVGRGVYYFVENLDGVTLAFADCLGGLLSVVAQNIKIDLTVSPNSDLTITSLKTKKSITTLTEGKRYEIQMGDMYAEEERDVLIVLDLPAAMTDSPLSSIIEFHVSYANVLTSKFEKIDTAVQIERVMAVPDTCVANAHIQKQKIRIQSTEAVEAAKLLAEKGDFTNAQATMAAAVKEVTFAMEKADVKEKGFVTKLWSDLKKSEASVTNQNVFAARGRHQMTSTMQSNYHQRCNSIDIEEYELDDQFTSTVRTHFDFNAPPPAQGAKGYRNQSKARMMKNAFTFMKK